MKIFNFDPRKPLSTFNLHMRSCQIVGVLPPASPKWKFLYEIYSWTVVITFLYMNVLSQFAYLATAKKLQDIAEALYIFLPDLVSICIHFHFKKYIHVVQKSIEKLESPLFLSKNAVEDGFLSWAIRRTLFFYGVWTGICFMCIFGWSVGALISDEKMALAVPAKFPLEYETRGVAFIVVWIYQNMAENFSALLLITNSTLFTGVFFHGAAQLRRLGQHLMKIGHEEEKTCDKNGILIVKEAPKNFHKRQEKIRQQLRDCIQHHQEIQSYCNEFLAAFATPVFIQLIISLFVLCFTLFQFIMTSHGNVLLYYVIMILEVWRLCYCGNELSYAADKLTESLYFANFLDFDASNKKLMIHFMACLNRETKINAAFIFKIPLEMKSFVQILRVSFSYFSVMKNVVNKDY